MLLDFIAQATAPTAASYAIGATIGGAVVAALGGLIRFIPSAKKGNGSATRKDVDALREKTDETYVRKETCEIARTQMHETLTEVQTDVKELLQRIPGKR